jgi:anti-sigma factor RsiW
MNCSEITEYAPLYLTEELDAARREAFSAHLRNCAACRRELEQNAGFDQRLRASVLAEPVDSAPVDRRVRESIHAEQRSSRHRMFAVAGIAAVLLLAIALFSMRARPLYAAAARDHRIEIVDRQPRKWLSDGSSIERLAGRAGLQASVVSAFTPAGYRLAQGKLCLLNGRVFLHLVYVNDAGNFSLFLRRPDDAVTSAIETRTFTAEHVAGFKNSQLSALIVTGQPGDTALHLAQSAAAAL